MAKCVAQDIIKDKYGNILSTKNIKRVSNQKAEELVSQHEYHYIPKSVWKRSKNGQSNNS